MHSHLPRLSRLLRASFMAMLLLGLVVKPVMAQLSDLHAVEHAVAGIAGHGNGHDHDHGSAQGEPAAVGDEDASDHGDHTAGEHGLMHQSGGSTTLIGLVPTLSVPMAFALFPDLPLSMSARIPGQTLTNPFRPPIA